MLMLSPIPSRESSPDLADKEPLDRFLTWDESMVSKFINKFFPPSKTTNLRNEITRIQQRFDESFYEAWDRFNDLLRECPHHGFSELHQLDTFYNALNSNDQDSLNSAAGSGTLPVNTITTLRKDLKVTELQRTTMLPTKIKKASKRRPHLRIKSNPKNPTSEPVVDPISAPRPNQQTSIPFPSRRNDERRREKANDQIEKFYEIFRDLSFEISFTDALTLMPKFSSTLKTLLGNREKLSEMARTPLNENCSAVILNKLPKKLGDPGRFLIPCEFFGINTCNALADLNASINLMPYSVWQDLALPELTPTCMTLELADRSITEPIGIAKDVHLMKGKFQFPTDFVVVDFEPDPRVPLILGRSFLKTSRALIDVYEGEITLRTNRIDVIELECEEYSQEVLGFSDSVAYGNPSPDYDPNVSNSSPTLTPFGDSDFLLLEEANAFIAITDEPNSREIDVTYYDPEGDILILEALLNSKPLPPLPNHKDYLPGIREERKVVEAKSSFDDPLEVELKDLPPHLEYVFLEGDNKLPVIIAKDLKDEEKAALIKGGEENKKGAENLARDHLPDLKTPHRDKLENKEINEAFPLGTYAPTGGQYGANYTARKDITDTGTSIGPPSTSTHDFVTTDETFERTVGGKSYHLVNKLDGLSGPIRTSYTKYPSECNLHIVTVRECMSSSDELEHKSLTGP
ncbi:reverse transcriptase domain-containing protein [Tanacetum coccineum]